MKTINMIFWIGFHVVTASEFHSLESIQLDILNEIGPGNQILEVQIERADSLRQKTFITNRSEYGIPCEPFCSEKDTTYHAEYSVTFKVLSNITADGLPIGVETIAIDERRIAELFWKKSVNREKISGQRYILILTKKKRVKALYPSRFHTISDEKYLEVLKRQTSKELSDLFKKSEYKKYLNEGNLIRILKREDIWRM